MKDPCSNIDLCVLSILFPESDSNIKSAVIRTRGQNITYIQSSLLQGFSSCGIKSINLINTLLVSLFPKGYRYPFVRKQAIQVGAISGINHPFINVPFLYSFSLFPFAKPHIRKWLKIRDGKQKVAIAYALTKYTLRSMKYIKSNDPTIKTLLIVPDLPQYTYGETANNLKKLKNTISKRIILKRIKRLSSFVDGWVLFSDQMKEQLPPIRHSVVFEGLCTTEFDAISPRKLCKDNEIGILYAGGLSKAYGIDLLLNAFELLEDPRYRLFIAGKGTKEVEELVKTSCDMDPRISYLGVVPREDLLAIEKGMSVLINPRINSGIFTRYSFPSKNMEYLSSGVPTIGFKLDGIPDEYDLFIHYPESETAEAISRMIREVSIERYDECVEIAKQAKTFVQQEKSSIGQAQKIIRLINRIE